MDGKTIQCLSNPSQHIPIYLQQFPSYSNRKCKKSPFSRTAAHIFVSPGDAPAIITQCVAWIDRQFNACQTPCSMYLSIFNSFRVIRCLSQCISPKITIFTIFLFALGTPSNYNRFWERARYWSKIAIFSYPLAFDAPVMGVSVGIVPPRLVWKN